MFYKKWVKNCQAAGELSLGNLLLDCLSVKSLPEGEREEKTLFSHETVVLAVSDTGGEGGGTSAAHITKSCSQGKRGQAQ
jgi:hypothetical protein